MEKDTAYRLILPSQLLQAAHEKAQREDLTLAQVLRRFLLAWVNDQLEVPRVVSLKRKPKKDKPIE